MEHDFLFKSELESCLSDNTLSCLSIAVSRQPELGHPKYVQHALKNHEEQVWTKLSTGNARIYICGDELTMVKEVNDLIVDLTASNLQVSGKEANAICQQWTKEGRIVRDIWI